MKFANTWVLERALMGAWEHCSLCHRKLDLDGTYWRIRRQRICLGCYGTLTSITICA